jgi:hypothetical protein
MNKNLTNYRNSIQVAGVIFGGLLITLPAIFQTANAQQTNTRTDLKVNPCPGIFYEEPHNSRVLVPQGCRPNAYTSGTNAQGMNSGNNVGATASPDQTQLGVGGETPNNSAGSASQNYNNQNGSQSMQQGTAVSSPQPLNYPNRGIPNSQIDPNTGNRVNGPAGGYTNQRQSSMDSQTNSNYQSNNQPLMNSQSSMSNSSTNQAVPNSQIDPNTGNRVNGPAGGYTNQRQSSMDSQTNSNYQSNNQPLMNSQSSMSNSSTNQAVPNSQIDPNTGNRVNGPAGGYTNQRQSSMDSQTNSNYQSNNQPLMNSQSSMSNSSTNQAVPNSQIDPNTGNRVNGPAGGYSNQRQSGTRSQINRTNGNRYQNAVATVSPTDGRVSVRLVNQTNAAIVYQVIGDTQLRTLAGRSEVMLQGLRTPTNVAFYRQDRGLLMVRPQGSSQNGMLDVTLQETADFAMDRTSMRIENNGAVYLN